MKTLTSLVLSSLVSVAGAETTNSFSNDKSSVSKDEVVAVNSYVANGYKRVKLPSGRFKPEVYAFGEGGFTAGRSRDTSTDDLTFNQVIRVIAKPLADQDYVTGKSPAETSLLIFVYWGTTARWGDGSGAVATDNWREAQSAATYLKQDRQHQEQTAGSHTEAELSAIGPRMQAPLRGYYASKIESGLILTKIENDLRDRQNERTASLIGYRYELAMTEGKQYAGLGPYRSELLSDIEDDRYFVVLVACDFQAALKTKQVRPLWWTRYNLRVRGNRFDEALYEMTHFASRYFGQDSKGLVRRRVPIGNVEIGETKVIELDSH